MLLQDQILALRAAGASCFGCDEVLNEVLPPGAILRKAAWEQEFQQVESAGGAYICDLDHWPKSRGPQAGPYMPTIISHSSLFSFRRERLVTSLELFSVHGAEVTAAAEPDIRYPCLDALKKMPITHRRQLVGNSLLLPAAGAFIFYILSNLVCLEEESPLPPNMNIYGPDHVDEEEVGEEEQSEGEEKEEP